MMIHKYDQTRIALIGKMRSGKDYIGGLLTEQHLLYRLAFGDGVRNVAGEVFGAEALSTKDRSLLQGVGQQLREVDPDVWVKYLERNNHHVWRDESPYNGYVITDLRQPNEYEWALANGFTIIKVEADLTTRISRMNDDGDVFNEKDLTHETESYIDSYSVDYVINNNDGMDVRSQLNDILDDIEGGTLDA